MKKILLAEDDKFLRTVYQQKLSEKKEWTILVAEDGEQAMQMITTEKPDLVIIDLMLPKKDGFQVITEMKQNETLKNIPIIISSALGQESDVKKGMDMGAVDYLTKTESTVGLIVEKVGEHLGKGQAAPAGAAPAPPAAQTAESPQPPQPAAPATPPAPTATPSTPPAAPAPEAAPANSKFCTSCGKPVPTDAKFCPSCGNQTT